MSTGEALYRLQLLDNDIDQVRRRVVEIDAHIKGTPALLHTRREAEKAAQALIEAQNAQQAAESEMATLDGKIAAEDKRLYAGAVKNPKEMVEIQDELASLKRRKQTQEDALLTLMTDTDGRREDDARCRKALTQAEAQHAEDSRHLQTERTSLLKNAVGYVERRAALVSSVPKESSDLYQKVRARKSNGIAVVLVRNEACGGCGDGVPSSQIQQAHAGTALPLCANCGRILFAM
jgi:uncharacterized protein